MKKDTKPKHGGFREGAGRKPKAPQTLRIGMRVSQQTYDILRQQKCMTAFTEAAIKEKYERERA